MPPKSEIVRKGGYKCWTLEMHLQLRDQQLNKISYIYIDSSKLIYKLLRQNFRIKANQKSTIDKQIRKINSKTTLKIVIKPKEERTRQEGMKKKATKTNKKHLIKWQ